MEVFQTWCRQNHCDDDNGGDDDDGGGGGGEDEAERISDTDDVDNTALAIMIML